MPDVSADLEPTPGQTIGPFFHNALPFEWDRELVPIGSPGAVRLHGYVYDGAGQPIPDALLEIRQADNSGNVATVEGSLRRSGTFTGWGRSTTDTNGHYWFSTLVPKPEREDLPAFFAVAVFARGLLDRVFTRIYLPLAPSAMATETLLAGLAGSERDSLIAVRDDEGSLRFDVHLQGEQETVFFTYPGHSS